MKRTELRRKTPLRANKFGISSTPRTPLAKRGKTKAKKVVRQKAFYSSAAWKRIRKAALTRAGYQCEFVCDVTITSTTHEGAIPYSYRCSVMDGLQVHHKTNVRFGGDELPEDLMAVCWYHHAVLERRDHPHRQRRVG